MIAEQVPEVRQSPLRSERVRPGVAGVRARVADLERHARALVRQRPIVAVLAAAGLGYLTARFVSRAVR